jgi:hypothetical protein
MNRETVKSVKISPAQPPHTPRTRPRALTLQAALHHDLVQKRPLFALYQPVALLERHDLGEADLGPDGDL